MPPGRLAWRPVQASSRRSARPCPPSIRAAQSYFRQGFAVTLVVSARRLEQLNALVFWSVAIVAAAIVASGVWLVGWPDSYSRIILSSTFNQTSGLWAFVARSSTRLRAAGCALIVYGAVGGLALLAASKGVDISGIHR